MGKIELWAPVDLPVSPNLIACIFFLPLGTHQVHIADDRWQLHYILPKSPKKTTSDFILKYNPAANSRQTQLQLACEHNG